VFHPEDHLACYDITIAPLVTNVNATDQNFFFNVDV
jgi:hypothetical protein